MTDQKRNKMCNECDFWQIPFENGNMNYECKKGIKVTAEDFNGDGWLEMDGPEVHPELFKEAIAACQHFKVEIHNP